MPDFPRALKEALDAHYSVRGNARQIVRPITHRQGLTARMNALEKAYGSKKAAAQAAGLNPTSWTRWKAGQRGISAANSAKLEGAYASITRALQVEAKGTPSAITVHAEVTFHGTTAQGQATKYKNAQNSGPHASNAPAGSGYRPFRADQLTHDQRADIAAAYAAGLSPRAVADAMLRSVERQYGSPVTFDGHHVIVDIT